jgi:hypothetical protein
MDGGTVTGPSGSKHYNWHSSIGMLMVLHDIHLELENLRCVLRTKFESDTSEMNTWWYP